MPEFFIRGGPIMWPLLGCSLIAITIAVERLIFWFREARRHDQAVVEHMLRCTERRDYSSAVQVGTGKLDAEARMLLSGLSHREHGLAASMQAAAGEEIQRMKSGLVILDTIITMAPLLGILGTVMGIIQSFDLLGGGDIGDPRSVIGGIAQALITTAAGLTVALVTLVPFNYLSARVERATRSLEQIATRLEIAYKRGLPNAADQRI